MISLIVMKSAQRCPSQGHVTDIKRTSKLARLADQVTMEQPNGDMVVRKTTGAAGPYFKVVLDPDEGQYFKTNLKLLDQDDIIKLSRMESAWTNAPLEELEEDYDG